MVLGLSLSDYVAPATLKGVKAHLKVDTLEGNGAEFTIQMPVSNK
jgi:hypothetical protein